MGGGEEAGLLPTKVISRAAPICSFERDESGFEVRFRLV